MSEEIQNNEVKTNQTKVKVLSFQVGYEAPKNKYNSAKGYVEWGDKNNYPISMVNYYNDGGSPTHKAAVDKKIRFACGNGFRTIKDQRLQSIVDEFIGDATIEAFSSFEVLNGFAFEIVWNRAGEDWSSFKAIPIHKLRIGIESDEHPYPHYLFSNNWKESRKEMYKPEVIKEYDSEDKTGKRIVYFADFNIGNDGLYPIANYSNSLNFVDIEAEYGRFHFNALAYGYSPDFLLNIATGIPGEEEQDIFFDEFQREMSNRGNARKIIITYSDGQDSKSELTTIQGNNSDQKFQLPMTSSVEMIARGHGIPPQLLILTDGLFGQDRDAIMQEFQEDYVSSRQKNMQRVLNRLLKDIGIDEKLELLTYAGEQDETTPEANDTQVQAQATLRGSVNGVTALLQIQASVAGGLTSRSSAQAAIELIYGFSTEEAIRLLGDVEETNKIETNE